MTDASLPPSVPPPPPSEVSDDAFLLAYLESHEAPCPACGYNAHMLVEARCPECGVALVLKVVCPQRVSKAWMAMMVAAAASAGVGALILMAIFRHGLPHSGRHGLLLMAFAYFVGAIPAPAVLMGLRQHIARYPRPKRIRLASLIGALTVIMFWLLFMEG